MVNVDTKPAVGNINREFSKLEKKAKKLRKLLKEGKISREAVERAQSQFTGLYKHVLINVLEAPDPEEAE